MKTYIFILLAISTVNLHAQSIQFNLKMIRSWTQNSSHSVQPPYLYEKNKAGKTLKYIAVKHSTNPNDATYTLIKKTISSFAPQLVIIEGVPSSLGLNDSGIKSRAEECLAQSTNDSFTCGESMYSVLLASKNNISFIGGEPEQSEQVNSLLNQNLTEKEIYFFFVARNLFGMKRSGQLTQNNLRSSYYQNLARYTNPSLNQYKFKKFKKWFQRQVRKKFSIANLESNDYAPFTSGHKLNEISNKLDKVREINILQTIEKSINHYNKVLVIYGASHLYKHQPVLDYAFQK